ncbi:MAG: hypothetical protein QG658_109 [Patescibacteria group bacterium]|nr:hypothetical protein [Patescibacteria group bacterium]
MNNKNWIIGIAAVVVVAIGGWLLFGNMNNSTSETSPSATEQASPEAAATQNIVELASANPEFSTLVTAIKAAGLVETLSSEGPFTVFAPTNAAFEKLPAGTLDSLLANPEQLKAVLTYHVVPDDVTAAEVVNLTSAPTVNGKTLTISVDGSTVKVNNATVTQTDIDASNGTIHVIDTVLIP